MKHKFFQSASSSHLNCYKFHLQVLCYFRILYQIFSEDIIIYIKKWFKKDIEELNSLLLNDVEKEELFKSELFGLPSSNFEQNKLNKIKNNFKLPKINVFNVEKLNKKLKFKDKNISHSNFFNLKF